MKRAIQEGTVALIPLIAFLFGLVFIKISLFIVFPLIILYVLLLIVLFNYHKDRLKNKFKKN